LPAGAGEQAPPRTLLILVDDLSLSLNSFDRTRRSLRRTIERIDPADRVELVTTARGYDALRPTTDRKATLASVDGLRLTPWTRGELMSLSSSQSTFFALQQGLGGYETADWTIRNALRSVAIIKQAIKDLQPLPGRKAMLLVSEGFSGLSSLGGSQIHDIYWPLDRLYGDSDDVLGAWRRLADFAARASVVIHAVDPRGLVTGGLNAEHRVPDATVPGRLADVGLAGRIALYHSQGTLQQLTDATGGLALLDRNDMGSAVMSILEDLAGYYLIGYEPSRETFEGGGYHEVDVKVKRPGLKVRSRNGFFAVTDEQVAAKLP
jgi:VWFA-related protein